MKPAIFATALLLSASGARAALPHARAFVHALYTPYKSDADLPDNLGAIAPTIFTSGLVALIRADQRAAGGEVGRLDSDPLCDCQDDNGLRVTAIDLSNQTATRAVAQVRLVFAIGRKTVTLYLRRTAAGWRVDDVGSPGTPSLRRLLGGRCDRRAGGRE